VISSSQREVEPVAGKTADFTVVSDILVVTGLSFRQHFVRWVWYVAVPNYTEEYR